MGSYLQTYGAGEERRNRIIRWIIISAVSVVVLLWIAYLVFRNYSEKRSVERFLAEVNAHDYQAAYRDWGCTEQHPCPNYDFKRFMDDWGQSQKVSSPWKVASIDGCRTFVTVNVQAQGAELQSLGVERGSSTLMFAPAPECQEPQWHWKQFFARIFGKSSS
jgi:hypothetical protein